MVSVVAHVSVSGLSGGTSSGINTTGANFLIGGLGYNGTGGGNVSDSLGNTWAPLTQYIPFPANDRSHRLFYVKNATVGSGHTFSTTTGIATLSVLAASGIDTTSPFDVENGGFSATTTTQFTGNITPSTNGQLIVTGSQNGSTGSQSVGGSFTTVENVNLLAGNYYGEALAYYVQPTAASIGATWTFTVNTVSAASIASFKEAAGGGTTISGNLGTAVASGHTANVNANRTIAGALGTASASGLQGNVNANRTIAGALGVATASGLAGNVNANRTIAGALGTAVASGFQGTVSNTTDTVIGGTLGIAVASGLLGNVNVNTTIAGNIGVAVASGFSGSVLNGTTDTLDLILKILVNRQELNPATGTFTLYDNDGTTVLYTTSAWADAAGTVPYSGGALRRIDALF